MIRLTVKLDDLATRSEIERLGTRLRDRSDLHQKLGGVTERLLKRHFTARDLEPNKEGWPKHHWWAGVARETQFGRVDAAGAEVVIAHDQGFLMRLRGGVIKPRTAEALTIPRDPTAKGVRAKVWEEQNRSRYEEDADGRVLFRPRGSRVLAAKPRNASDRLDIIYVLAKSVTIKADPDALPPEEQLIASLEDEASDWIDDTLASLKS